MKQERDYYGEIIWMSIFEVDAEHLDQTQSCHGECLFVRPTHAEWASRGSSKKSNETDRRAKSTCQQRSVMWEYNRKILSIQLSDDVDSRQQKTKRNENNRKKNIAQRKHKSLASARTHAIRTTFSIDGDVTEKRARTLCYLVYEKTQQCRLVARQNKHQTDRVRRGQRERLLLTTTTYDAHVRIFDLMKIAKPS